MFWAKVITCLVIGLIILLNVFTFGLAYSCDMYPTEFNCD